MRALVAAAVIAAAAWVGAALVRRELPAPGGTGALATAPPPANRLEQDVLGRARQAAGDPDLNARFARLNRDYFGGALPAVPVSWEPQLIEIAALRGDGLILEGLTDGHAIVVNPSLATDLRTLVATLCHEMVHVRLTLAGGPVGEDHGPEFQQHLRRLLDEGAFEGAYATDDEKVAMRASMTDDARWLDAESAALTNAADRLRAERARVDALVEDLNARITAANDVQRDWPSDAEQSDVKARLAALNTRAAAHNARVKTFNQRIDAYNRTADRYNLVNAYPDGLAATRVAPRPTLSKVSGQ
jgi:hypothetical protein